MSLAILRAVASVVEDLRRSDAFQIWWAYHAKLFDLNFVGGGGGKDIRSDSSRDSFRGGCGRAQDLADGDLDAVGLVIHPLPCFNPYIFNDEPI